MHYISRIMQPGHGLRIVHIDALDDLDARLLIERTGGTALTYVLSKSA